MLLLRSETLGLAAERLHQPQPAQKSHFSPLRAPTPYSFPMILGHKAFKKMIRWETGSSCKPIGNVSNSSFGPPGKYFMQFHTRQTAQQGVQGRKPGVHQREAPHPAAPLGLSFWGSTAPGPRGWPCCSLPHPFPGGKGGWGYLGGPRGGDGDAPGTGTCTSAWVPPVLQPAFFC